MAPAMSKGSTGLDPKARLVQTVLYAFAPFFGYPWKPILNSVYGGDYESSYKHFRAQHMDGSNLAMHSLCLVWQLSSNYALLGEIDRLLEDGLQIQGLRAKPMTRITSVLWCAHLLRTSPTPVVVKFASVLSIMAAHNFLGPLFDKYWRQISMLQGLIEGAAVQLLVLKTKGLGPAPALIWFALRTLAWKALSAKEGCLREHVRPINAALVALVTAAAASKQPLKPTIIPMALFGWTLALATGSKLNYFWASGMIATICQGIAHELAGEQPTLLLLQEAAVDTTAYEFSHVTFFPNLLFQAVRAHVKASS